MCECWNAHNHWAIPADSLSDYGLVYEKDNEVVAFSFIYFMANSRLAQIAWTTTNPKMGLKLRHKAVTEILFGLEEIARKQQRKHLICFSASTGINKILKKVNFTNNKEHTLMIGSL